MKNYSLTSSEYKEARLRLKKSMTSFFILDLPCIYSVPSTKKTDGFERFSERGWKALYKYFLYFRCHRLSVFTNLNFSWLIIEDLNLFFFVLILFSTQVITAHVHTNVGRDFNIRCLIVCMHFYRIYTTFCTLQRSDLCTKQTDLYAYRFFENKIWDY